MRSVCLRVLDVGLRASLRGDALHLRQSALPPAHDNYFSCCVAAPKHGHEVRRVSLCLQTYKSIWHFPFVTPQYSLLIYGSNTPLVPSSDSPHSTTVPPSSHSSLVYFRHPLHW